LKCLLSHPFAMWLRMDGAPGRFAMKPKKDLVQSLSSSFVSLVPFLDERQNLFSVAFGVTLGKMCSKV